MKYSIYIMLDLFYCICETEINRKQNVDAFMLLIELSVYTIE